MSRHLKLIRSTLIFPMLAIFAETDALSRDVRLYKSAYHLGRGDTGIAIADDHEAIFYNPAGVAQGKGIYKETVLASPNLEGSAAIKDLYRKYAVENNQGAETLVEELGKNQHIGFYNFSGVVFRRAALGATLSTTTNILPYRAPEAGGLPVVHGDITSNQMVSFTLAENFFLPNLFMGVNGKFINRQEADIDANIAESDDFQDQLGDGNVLNTASGGGGDFGLMYRGSNKKAPFSLGLMVENMGGVKMQGATDADQMDDLPQMIHVGVAIEPGTKVSIFRFLLDYRDVASGNEENPLKKIHIGTELSIRDTIGVTSGLHQGYSSVGAYLDLYALRFDIGTYTEEVSDRIGERPDQRYFLRLKAGF